MNHPQPSHPSAASCSKNITWSGPLSQHPLPPARHQPHPLISTAHGIIQEEKKSRKKIYLPTNHIYLPWPTYIEPSHKKVSDKINRLTPRRKNTTENRLYHTAWTHKQEPSN